MRRFATCISCLALLGATAHHAKTDPDAALFSKAKGAVADKMKDPGSVQFRNLRARPGDGPDGRKVCGEFNAKNGFGGYVGFSQFVYQAAYDDVALPDDQLFPVYLVGC